MKILIPIIGFGKAGGYRVLSELANHWLLTGHQVHFLVDERSEEPYFPTSATILRFDRKGRIMNHDAKIRRAVFSINGNAFSIYFGMLRALQRVGATYDVILANHSLTAIPVALARTGLAKKFYYIQAYEPEYYELEKGSKSKILKWLSAMSYKLPLHQIVNAPIYIGYGGISAAEWIPPGIDASIFYRRPSLPLFGKSQPWSLGVIGRLESTKGTRYALEAFEELASTDPYVHLKIAFGNLPDGWHHDRAEVVIPRNDGELADYYRSVDIMLAPGTVQLGACHYPVLESMSCGTPIVTTGYLPANDHNSWLVPVCDSRAIVRAVQSIKSASPLELENKINEACKSIRQFYWNYVAKKFIDVIVSS